MIDMDMPFAEFAERHLKHGEGRKSASCDGSPVTAGKSIRSAITMLEDALVTCEMNQPGAAKILINVARSYLNGAEELLFKSR
jgi:hypothetical protein